MTHNPVGFAGDVDQVEWARLMSTVVGRFVVRGADSWKPTIGGGDRVVNVAVGFGYACGVLDTTNESENNAFDANTSGSDRFDLLVATYTWIPDGAGTVVFEKVKGTPGAGPPNPTTALVRNPGVKYQGVIAVVRVRNNSLLTSDDLFDVRPQAGRGGPLIVADGTYLQYLDADTGQLAYVVKTGVDVRKNADGTWGSQYFVPTFAEGFSGNIRAAKASSGMVTLAGTLTYSGDKTGTNVPVPFTLPPAYRPMETIGRIVGFDQIIITGTSEVRGSVNVNGNVSLGLTANNTGGNIIPRTAFYSVTWPTA